MIILVVNVQEGVVPLDREVAARLRRSGKPVLVAVNKVDHRPGRGGRGRVRRAGLRAALPGLRHSRRGHRGADGRGGEVAAGPSRPCSEAPSAGGARCALPAQDGEPAHEPELPGDPRPLKLAIVGRPNVGKSSIINALTQSERVIVSPVPGTTRDAVDVPFEVETDGVRQSYVLIDTAGMRKTRRVDDSIEFFSVKRAEDSIARCDIAVLVLDAEAGITEQDKKIGDLIVEERKACVVVVNKWDLVAEAVRQAREEEIARRQRQGRPAARSR